jgi:hypothetical protein
VRGILFASCGISLESDQAFLLRGGVFTKEPDRAGTLVAEPGLDHITNIHRQSLHAGYLAGAFFLRLSCRFGLVLMF